MGKIIVLDQNVSNKIAAGEVVERPSSVVKELVENCIDAKASAITIEIKNGGITFIRVTDNGCGISNDEAVVAFMRHATSKITNIEDLNSISTLGFRGEALASISAVSQIELITKIKNNITGTLIEMNGGKLIKSEEVGCPDGTTIVVKNLFYNTPARLKFLKKESTEAGIISDLIERLALTHPEISFKLINNNQTILHTSGNVDSLTTILSVFGKDFAKGMIPVNLDTDGISIIGFIGRPEISRSNRNYQCIFINRRYIKNKTITSALETAYKTVLTINRYPVAILYININPKNVDVNVHPAKMEVKFDNDEIIYNLVYEAVSTSLKNSILVPQIKLSHIETKKSDIDKTNTVINDNKHIFEKDNYQVNETSESYFAITSKQPELKRSKDIEIHSNEPISIKEIEQQEVKINKSFKVIGQIFSTYIIAKMEDKMFIIDQHAAHERIKFNELIMKYNDNKHMSQTLISPIVINLSFSEYKIAKDHFDDINSIGFEVEDFGDNSILIRSVPYVLDNTFAKEFFVEIIDTINKKKINNILDLREDMLFSMACKSAIKANRTLTESEMNALVENVLKMEDAFTCPHGRPVIISISKYELEKMFKRVQ